MRYVLLGASGTAKVIISSLLKGGCSLSDITVVDDDRYKKGNIILGVSVDNHIESDFAINCVGSTGDNTSRNNVFRRNLNWIGYVDWSCNTSYSIISQSAILLPNVVVNAGSIIGKNVLINTGSIIEHDCKVGENTFISPGCNIAGNVTIGKNVFIGIGTTIIGGVTIGDNVVIGAGSLVLRDVESNSKVYGHPVHK